MILTGMAALLLTFSAAIMAALSIRLVPRAASGRRAPADGCPPGRNRDALSFPAAV